MDDKNIKLLQNLLHQITERDIMISKLTKEITKIRELQIIREHEKDKRYKNTKWILLSLLFISMIVNILLLLK